MLAPAALVAAGGIVVALGSGTWLSALLGVAGGVVAASLASISVTVDRRGRQVRYGRLRWPRTHIPLERIELASAIEVEPGRWGGWGYRGSLGLFRRAAVVLRRGPGIRLDLVEGATFAVTVERPEVGAALLDALRG